MRKVFTGFFSILFLNVLVGCSGAFQPLPPYYINWSKPGSTVVDIKKVILECGKYNPSGTYPEDSWPSENEMVQGHYCIINAGYTYLNPFKGGKSDNNSWCRNKPGLPACQPGAVIPEPSIERRLRSNYCRSRLSYEECMVIVNDIDGIICPRRNYEKPLFECLP
jgi:hypothetical protein